MIEKLQNSLLDRVFLARKVDPSLFRSKTVICVVYVEDCLFWEISQYNIDKAVNYFKENSPSYNFYHSKV